MQNKDWTPRRMSPVHIEEIGGGLSRPETRCIVFGVRWSERHGT